MLQSVSATALFLFRKIIITVSKKKNKKTKAKENNKTNHKNNKGKIY